MPKLLKDYSQLFETTPRQEYHNRTKDRFRDKFKVYQRKASLQKTPLQERSWWKTLTPEQQHLFLTEYDVEKQSINEFRSYLTTLTKNSPENQKGTLTERQVREIKWYLAEGIPGIETNEIGGYLARKYNVSRQTINNIKLEKTYRKIK
jgi:hypothetical protein